MPTFATFLHPETLRTARPTADDEFRGFSLPSATQVRAGLADWINDDFQTLVRRVLAAARAASCPMLSVQGGGYKLPVTITAVASHIATLAHGEHRVSPTSCAQPSLADWARAIADV